MNAAGIAQVERLSAILRETNLDAAYTSPLGRSRTTADMLLRGRGVQAVSDPDLAELSYGTLQGQVPREWPEELRSGWQAAPWSITFPEGESLELVRRRAIPVVRRIVTAHPREMILVSAHGHLNRVVIMDLLSLDRDSFWSIAQPNAGAYRIEFSAASFDRPRVSFLDLGVWSPFVPDVEGISLRRGAPLAETAG